MLAGCRIRTSAVTCVVSSLIRSVTAVRSEHEHHYRCVRLRESTGGEKGMRALGILNRKGEKPLPTLGPWIRPCTQRSLYHLTKKSRCWQGGEVAW